MQQGSTMPNTELDALTTEIEWFRREAAKPENHGMMSMNVPVQLMAHGDPTRKAMTAREEAAFILRFRAEVAAKKRQPRSDAQQYSLMASSHQPGSAPVLLDLENAACVTITGTPGGGMAFPSEQPPKNTP
jgi:hypothetical protein